MIHIKPQQKIAKFDGKEATLYAIKMSSLYRIVIVSKLNIDESLYKNTL